MNGDTRANAATLMPLAGDPELGGPALLGIGDAATRLGVSERALRYYQQLGLLTPSGRTPGGLRRYSPSDLARVQRIRELQSLLGFNLDEIKTILEDEDRVAVMRQEYEAPETTEARRRELARDGIVVHEQLRDSVQAKIDRLMRFRSDLDTKIAHTRENLAEAAEAG